jgi:hypothetical protein
MQSLVIIFDGRTVARGADGIPLDAYPPDAAQTAVALFAQGALWRLFIALLCVLVLVRYRSAVPFMFVVLALGFLGSQLLLRLVPFVRVGAPPGPYVNLATFALMVVGLALSLWPRRGEPAAPGRRV